MPERFPEPVPNVPGRFKAPDPMPMERYDLYFVRLIQCFEDWVNERYLVDSTRPPAA